MWVPLEVVERDSYELGRYDHGRDETEEGGH